MSEVRFGIGEVGSSGRNWLAAVLYVEH